MKVKDLIAILQTCNPDSEVLTKWEDDTKRGEEYRKACCWLVVNEEMPYGKGEDALQSFSIVGAEVTSAEETQCLDGYECTLLLDQDYYLDSYVGKTMHKLRNQSKDENKEA